jgi:Helix-turn-helix domain
MSTMRTMRTMRTIQRAYKVELDLKHAQTTACTQHAGAARWTYN